MRWPQRPSKRWFHVLGFAAACPEAQRGQGKGQGRSASSRRADAGGMRLPTAQRAVWDRFPAIVKPVREHCSIGSRPKPSSWICMPCGTHRFRHRDLPAARPRGGVYRRPRVPGDLWGNRDVEVLPPVEMEFSAFSDLRERLCSWDAKFTPGSRPYNEIRTVAPAPLTAEELRLLEEVSRAAYRPWDPGLRRFDFRLREGSSTSWTEPQPRHQRRRQPGPYGGARWPLLRTDGQPARAPRRRQAPVFGKQ